MKNKVIISVFLGALLASCSVSDITGLTMAGLNPENIEAVIDG